MKTALTIITAIIVPGGLIILAIGFATVLLHRYRTGQQKAATQVVSAAAAA